MWVDRKHLSTLDCAYYFSSQFELCRFLNEHHWNFLHAHTQSHYRFHARFKGRYIICSIRDGGTGCAGYSIAHPLFEKIVIETSFQQKKQFWKSVKNWPSKSQKCKMRTHFSAASATPEYDHTFGAQYCIVHII